MAQTDPFAGLDDGAVSQEDYVAARDALLEAYRLDKEAAQDAKEARGIRDQAATAFTDMMIARGETMVKTDAGVSIIRVEKTHYSCKADQRDELMGWAPAELHSVNAGTLSAYCRERVEAEEELPDFITAFKKAGLQVRGLKQETKP